MPRPHHSSTSILDIPTSSITTIAHNVQRRTASEEAVIRYIIPSTLYIIFKLTFIYQVFDLPDNLLSHLVLKTGREVASPPEVTETPVPTSNQDGEATATSCGLCGTNSITVEEQRAHARSDFHRFNLKRKIAGQAAVSEAEFEKMLEGG